MKKELSITDYRVEHRKIYQNDCTSIDYAFVWVPELDIIQNPPEFPDEDVEIIKGILHKNGIFELKINLQF